MPLPQTHSKLLKYWRGFTLAELLISLAILGVIATFTIPKILLSYENARYTANAKETIAMISEAYQQYKLQRLVTNATNPNDLTPFMNYVTIDTTSLLDNQPGQTWIQCSSGSPCLKLHNGSTLLSYGVCNFSALSTTNAIYFHLDPDGIYSGLTTGPSKSAIIFIYPDGRVTSFANISPSTRACGTVTLNPNPTNDPSWMTF